MTDNISLKVLPIYQGGLTYFGERHGGYGPSSPSYEEPYKSCEDTIFNWTWVD